MQGKFRNDIRSGKLLLLFAGLTLASPTAARDAAHDDGAVSAWHWREADPRGRTLRIHFVRGDIRVIRRPGPLEIRITRRAYRGYATDAEIIVAESDASFDISDHYPPGPAWISSECLPPIDERGDFWRTVVRLDAEVRAPASMQVRASVMDGSVRGAD